MSKQEQDAVVGQMVAEYSTAKRELAVLLRKAAIHSKALGEIAGYLKIEDDPRSPHYRPYRGMNLTGATWNTALEKIPPKEVLSRLAEEITSTTQRKRELFDKLKKMGFEQKD